MEPDQSNNSNASTPPSLQPNNPQPASTSTLTSTTPPMPPANPLNPNPATPATPSAISQTPTPDAPAPAAQPITVPTPVAAPSDQPPVAPPPTSNPPLDTSATAITNSSADQAPPQQKSGIQWLWIIICIAMFILGVSLMYLFTVIGRGGPSHLLNDVEIEDGKIALPTDAIKIQGCANHKGTLYVKPENIPVGPVYMVHEGEVIGIEFMLNQDQVTQGKDFLQLDGAGITIDHVNIGLLSEGHEGYELPHYHVDIYAVSPAVQQSIKCPETHTDNHTHPTIAPTPTDSIQATDAAQLESTDSAQTEPSTATQSATASPSGILQ